MAGSKKVFINPLIIYIVLFNIISISYLFRVDRLNYIINVLFFINFFFLTVGFKYRNDLKRKCIDLFFIGLIFCALRVSLWMLLTNSFVKGGMYIESTIVSSNLDLPLMLSSIIIFLFLKLKNFKLFGKIFSYLLIALSLFLLIFLQKRMPFISIILTLFFIPLVIDKKWFAYIFVTTILFFPIFGKLIMNLVEPIVGFITVMLGRTEVQDTTRTDRWEFAGEMFSNFQFSDLFYYHGELYLSYSEAHNHFHNTYLQIYADKGLISLVIIIILIFKAVHIDKRTIAFNKVYRKISVNDIQMYRLLFLNMLIISTNESMMRPVSFPEFLFISLLFINIDLSVFKVKQKTPIPMINRINGYPRKVGQKVLNS
jgi:O-antigen ligase